MNPAECICKPITYHQISHFKITELLTEDVKIKFKTIIDGGAKGTVIVKFSEQLDGNTVIDIKDAIIRVIAPYVEAAKQ